MSPSPPLRKSGKDAPFEAGVLIYGLHTDLLSAPSHPVGQWLFRSEFRCRSQLRGQWRFCTALPAHLKRIVFIKEGMQRALYALAIFPLSNIWTSTGWIVLCGGN